MPRIITTLLYGVLAYLLFLGVFLCALALIGGLLTPTSLDGSAVRPLLAVLWAGPFSSAPPA